MNSSMEAILIIVLLGVIVLTVSMISHNKSEREKFFRKTQKNWGAGAPPEYTEEAFRQIRIFSDFPSSKKDGTSEIDDITWNDSDMDSVFQKVNRTMSSPGEDVLYSWLRHPLLETKELLHRDRMITEFQENRELRQKVRMILYRIGRGRKGSYFEDICRVAKAPREGSGKYIFLCFLTIFSVILLFIQPVAGICVMTADFILNIGVHLRKSKDYRRYIRGFRELLKELKGAEQLMKLHIPELSGDNGNVRAVLDTFRGFQRGSFFVTGSGSYGTGIGDVILEYVNLFFHFDRIRFDKMAGQISGKEDEIYALTDFIGTLDAAVSAASFREFLKAWCRPDLKPGQVGFLNAEQLYHPLLESPVKNDISTDGGNLITGANASGKSTFLKSVSIGAILAQSICTVPANRWEAPFFRVYTSMALNDNLSGGESYFVVEIRSLKRIMDAAADAENEAKPCPVLGMIDEVLRGTNTIERIAASAEVLRKLNDGNPLIFAATHDIELTQILKDCYHNYHFSGTVGNGDVIFDYKIKNGPTRERNAIALMKASGYDPSLAERAEECARRFEETGEWKI